MSQLLLIALPESTLSKEQLELVRAAAPGKKLVVTNERTKIEELLPDIEIVAGSFPKDLISRAVGLRWFQQWGAGADWILSDSEASSHDFVLTNASGVHSVPITEHIFALLLAFGRGLPDAFENQKQALWPPSSFPSIPGSGLFELVDQTMMVVGVGAFGARTAKIAKAFGMRTGCIRSHWERPVPNVDLLRGPGDLLELLPESDSVVLTVPSTPETRGMIGEPELRAMKETTVIINIGRGSTIQENVLARALEEGWIRGAGLDVFENEPLPETSPLWRNKRVIITPHYAGSTPRYHQRALAIFVDNLGRYRRGETLRNVVNKKLGY
ncbi:MAG: D-2-hydroxyacid dehydrogenase [Deinococcales bacterium]|nr:D-2-hydroxyacid dehydrogenase [Deinococcales bacterium]